MNRTAILCFVVGIVCGLVSMAAIAGCSTAADRTVTIFQFQSDKTMNGQFRINTDALPLDAIESREDEGKPGAPKTRLKLNMDYDIEIVLRPLAKVQSTN